MANPFSMFETDPELEKKGVKVDYGDYWFYVARAGGKNETFVSTLRQRLDRVSRGGPRSVAADKIADAATREVFIEHCLRGWGSLEHGEGKMVGRANEAIPYSLQAAEALFEALPDLLNDLVQTVSNGTAFRKDLVDADTKN
jgi:hypothetical protein